MYKYVALIVVVIIVYNFYLHTKKWNIHITNIKNTIFHTKDNQKLVSIDNENINELFGDYSYKTIIYNTNYEDISITENVEKRNTNKYILWLNGTEDVFCHPFVTKELINKGYDIYVIDFPNVGFAQNNLNDYAKYPYTSQLLEYLDVCIKLINKKYFNPEIILYGFSFGSLLGLSYISIYGNIFSKLILHSV